MEIKDQAPIDACNHNVENPSDFRARTGGALLAIWYISEQNVTVKGVDVGQALTVVLGLSLAVPAYLDKAVGAISNILPSKKDNIDTP